MGDDGCGEFELNVLRYWRLRRETVVFHVAARQQRLIAALAIKGPCLRTYLAGLLWPEYPDTRALESLRVSLHLASRQLPGLLTKDGEMLALHDAVNVDLHRIRSQILAYRENMQTVCNPQFVHEWRDVELLPGWYDDWVVFEQGRLGQERLRAFTSLSRNSLAFGDFETAAEAAEAALQIEPLYEPAVSALVAAGIQGGDAITAIRVYERYRRQLEKEMGVLPGQSVRRLVAHSLEQYDVPASKEHLDSTSDSRPTRQPLLNHR